MFNIAVINLKSLLKKVIKLAIAVIFIAMAFNFIHKININKINVNKINVNKISIKKFGNSYINLISNNLIISKINELDETANSSQMILSSELVMFSELEKELMLQESLEEVSGSIVLNEDISSSVNGSVSNNKKGSINDNINSNVIGDKNGNLSQDMNENMNESINDDINKNSNSKDIDISKYTWGTNKSLPTTIIEENNKKDIYTHTYGSVKIKNESKYELTQDMLTPNVEFNNKKDILIFHTHTCESYTPTEAKQYVATGNFRTTDLNYTVAHVGEVLTNYLSAKGYNVTHNQTYHDFPAYTGSYDRSYKTVSSLLAGGAWTELVIDLHRDALGSSSEYAPSVKIGDEIAAQLMFVMGTDGGGLKHPNWLNNLKLAISIQQKANEMYPGLFKPIIIRNSRYNQNLASGACIIEVGATGNTLEQCEVSMKYLSNVIDEIMK